MKEGNERVIKKAVCSNEQQVLGEVTNKLEVIP